MVYTGRVYEQRVENLVREHHQPRVEKDGEEDVAGADQPEDIIR
jgi:hypothetical protein